MLQNANLVAKICADRAENDRKFAEILPKFAKFFRNFAKFAIFQTNFLRKIWDCSGAKVCKSCRAWKMLSNTYVLAKFRFDTAENEPAKNLQNFAKILAKVRPCGATRRRHCEGILAGSFSAVSKWNFVRKYAFDSIFQALQDLHTFAPLQSQIFRKKSVWKIANFAN